MCKSGEHSLGQAFSIEKMLVRVVLSYHSDHFRRVVLSEWSEWSEWFTMGKLAIVRFPSVPTDRALVVGYENVALFDDTPISE